MTRVRPYYAPDSLSAAFYDVVTRADPNLAGDIDLYAGLAAPGASILELGAGGGRIALALAARGHAVTGVDLSPAMLKRAEAARAAAPAEIAERTTFRLGDMTALDLKRSFELVLCPYFTLAHVPAGAAWRNTFAVIARHMAPGALAAVHLPLRDLMSRAGKPDPAQLVLDQPLADGGRLQLHVLERRFTERLSKLDQVLDYVQRDARGAVVRRSAERLTYYVADPAPFAGAAGLSLDREPIALGGVGQIFVFRRG